MRIKYILINSVATIVVCGVMALTLIACPNDEQVRKATYSYVCANGIPDDGDADAKNITQCTSCELGYILDTQSGACRGPRYTCSNGTPAIDATLATDGNTNCAACDAYYKFSDIGGCEPTIYTCSNGVAASGSPADDTHAIIYSNVERCISCDNGYGITDDNRCDETLTFNAQLMLNGSPSANTATISIVASDDTELWWVVYSEGTIIDAPETVIADASGAGGAKRSGADGVSIYANNPHTIVASDLEPSTSYVFYAAMVKDSTDEKFLSTKLDFSTGSIEIPAFVAQPTATAIDTTTATVSLSVDEVANLYWVVYSSVQSELTASQLKADVEEGGGIISDDNGTVTAHDATIINLTGLKPKKNYYFYAVVQDGDDNLAISSVLPLTTDGYPFVCSNGTAVNDTTTTENITNCDSCENYYRLDNDNSCIATVYTCTNGTPDSSTPADDIHATTNADVPKCGNCLSGYKKDGDACEPTIYTCANGTPATGSPSGNADVEQCRSCNPGYVLNSNQCVAFALTHKVSIADNDTYNIGGVSSTATATIAGTTYLFTIGYTDNGVSVFSVGTDGTLSHITSVSDSDNSMYKLSGAISVTIAEVGGTTYLFVTGFYDHSVSVFSVGTDGTLSHVTSVVDNDTYNLRHAISSTATTIAGTTYLFVVGLGDNGVSVFSVDSDGTLIHTASVDDNDTYFLSGARSVTTAVVANTTYLFVAGYTDNGVSVFSVDDDGVLTYIDGVNESDDVNAYRLIAPISLTTATIAGNTYLFVSGYNDNGFTVFSVGTDGTLSYVTSVADSNVYLASGIFSIATATIAGNTYLLVASTNENGVSVFYVNPNGMLAHVASVSDNDSTYLVEATTAFVVTVGEESYLLATGYNEGGVNVFSIP